MGGFIPHPDSKEAKKKDNRDGCDCKKCKEFYPYAEPNQEDGTLVCYKCRMGW
jgi:formylmethanofuran dehydrogenase subunit E